MRNKCLRLRAKDVWCSGRTVFCRGEILSGKGCSVKASSMGPTSPIPHVKSLLCEDCSLWLELSAAEVEGVAGFLTEGPPPNTSECGGMAFRGVLSHPLECLLRLMFRSPHLWQTPYRFERRVFCNGPPCLSRRLFPSPG